MTLDAAARGVESARSLAATVAIAAATMLTLLGISIGLFFNPAWVAFEQDRARADLWTGYTPQTVHAVTESVVAEVFLGPGTFAQTVAGAPVFNTRERAHMADVRRIVVVFAVVVLAGILVLLLGGIRWRGRAWFWGAVARGAAILAVGAVVIGAAFAFAFDQAFTLFHEILFPAGTWTFDPATDRLVQLFPDQFWTETSVAIAVVGLALTVGTWAVARHMARRLP